MKRLRVLVLAAAIAVSAGGAVAGVTWGSPPAAAHATVADTWTGQQAPAGVTWG